MYLPKYSNVLLKIFYLTILFEWIELKYIHYAYQKRGMLITTRLKALQQARPTNRTTIPRIKHETNDLSCWTFECCRFLGQDFHLVY